MDQIIEILSFDINVGVALVMAISLLFVWNAFWLITKVTFGAFRKIGLAGTLLGGMTLVGFGLSGIGVGALVDRSSAETVQISPVEEAIELARQSDHKELEARLLEEKRRQRQRDQVLAKYEPETYQVSYQGNVQTTTSPRLSVSQPILMIFLGVGMLTVSCFAASKNWRNKRASKPSKKKRKD